VVQNLPTRGRKTEKNKEMALYTEKKKTQTKTKQTNKQK
jgi:hypothetical protein